MRQSRRSVQRWLSEAWPIVRSLMEAEDRLISASESPAVVVLAACDQLNAATRHAHTWLNSQRCPDYNFGINFRELISACQGLNAIMQRVVREAPEGRWTGNRVRGRENWRALHGPCSTSVSSPPVPAAVEYLIRSGSSGPHPGGGARIRSVDQATVQRVGQ